MVLITDEAMPRVVLTKRQQGIRFAGQLCFPGGRTDTGETSLETALREAEEEIGLASGAVEVLGSYGHYYTQAGFRIDPFVGIVAADYAYQPDPAEVASLHYLPLSEVLNPAAYKLKPFNSERAYFAFEQEDVYVGGPTVSLMIGLLEWLAEVRQTAA
jgi:mutator protein MutT